MTRNTDPVIIETHIINTVSSNPHDPQLACRCLTERNTHADVCKVYSERSGAALTLMTAVEIN